MMMLVIVVVLLLSLLSIVLSYQRVDQITSRYTLFKPLTTLLKTSTRLHGDLLIGNITTLIIITINIITLLLSSYR